MSPNRSRSSEEKAGLMIRIRSRGSVLLQSPPLILLLLGLLVHARFDQIGIAISPSRCDEHKGPDLEVVPGRDRAEFLSVGTSRGS